MRSAITSLKVLSAQLKALWDICRCTCCSAMAVLEPHLILAVLPCPPSLPALSPWCRALRSIDDELGTAKSTNTFLSLILYPVPTLQFKSQGAKQKTHTIHKQLFLSYPVFLPLQHMGHLDRRRQWSYTCNRPHVLSAENWSSAE